MATYTVDKVTYNGNTYNLQDAGALQKTGGTVTGPVTFDDTITTNDIQTTTINDVEVGDSPKFTDTVTTATTTGDGNAITSITASNGALNVQKSTTFIHAAGTGLSKSGSTLNHSNSITAGTVGTSSNTSGVTIAVPYATYDAQGHITNKGTHTHTVTTATASANGVGRVAGGTNVSVTYSSGVATVNAPSNVSAFTNDAGYITEADIPEGAAAYTGTPSAVSTTAAKGESNGFARGDHVHNITGTTITDALGYTPYNSTNPNGYTSNTGTVTGVKINGTTKNPTSGVVDIGTVLTSYTETDPVYSASAAAGITSSDITNWNSKTSNTGTVTGVTAGTGLKVGTNTSGGTISTSGTINHINSVTAKTTQGLYPITYDAQGHITGSGSAITVPTASSTTPKMDGAAAVGSGTTWARADHIHPSDSSKVDAESTLNDIVGGIVNMDGTVGLGSIQQNIASDIDITPSQLTLSARNSDITNSLSLTSTQTTIKNVVTPVDNGDAVPKSYVDSQVSTKQATLVSGTNIKTINGTSLLGSGNITTPDTDEKLSTAVASTDTAYYLVLGNATTSAETKYYDPKFNYYRDSDYSSLAIGDVNSLSSNSDVVSLDLVTNTGASSITASGLTNIHIHTLPDKSGTFALTSDITDNKVAQNNSTDASDYRVLLSSSVSDSNQTAEANKSANLRFMPSTSHLYVGSSGNDALISVSPRVHLGTLPAYYNQDGSTISNAAYGFAVGITNANSYTNYLTTSSLKLQRWNEARPSGGTPSSTNYVQTETYLNSNNLIVRRYSGKNTLSTSVTLEDTALTFVNTAGDSYTVTPVKINKWDSYTDTKNTAGSTNTSSKIFLVGATSQAANPQTYSHDTAYVGTNGHLYSNSKQVVNLSDTQTISNKTLTTPVLNQPEVSSVILVTQASFWTVNNTNTDSVTAFAAYRWGNLMSVRMNVKTKSTVDTGTTATLGTVGANYKSATLVYANTRSHTAPYDPYTGGSVWITGDTISCRLPASTWVNLSLVYLINPDA